MVPIAGLLVPVDVAARIIAAFRGIYTPLTEGLNDADAVQAVLLHLITSSLVAYEGARTEATGIAEQERVRQEFQAKAEAVRSAARESAKRIKKAPPVPLPPLPPPPEPTVALAQMDPAEITAQKESTA